MLQNDDMFFLGRRDAVVTSLEYMDIWISLRKGRSTN